MLSLYSFVTNYGECTASQLADLSSERALTHERGIHIVEPVLPIANTASCIAIISESLMSCHVYVCTGIAAMQD